jgi:hypothetical protein
MSLFLESCRQLHECPHAQRWCNALWPTRIIQIQLLRHFQGRKSIVLGQWFYYFIIGFWFCSCHCVSVGQIWESLHYPSPEDPSQGAKPATTASEHEPDRPIYFSPTPFHFSSDVSKLMKHLQVQSCNSIYPERSWPSSGTLQCHVIRSLWGNSRLCILASSFPRVLRS